VKLHGQAQEQFFLDTDRVPGSDEQTDRHNSLYCGWWAGGLAYSGSALVSINIVTLRRARLVLGWVKVDGPINHLGM